MKSVLADFIWGREFCLTWLEKSGTPKNKMNDDSFILVWKQKEFQKAR
jgi:hypothetical protein